MARKKRLPVRVQRAYGALRNRGGILCRQFSDSEDARARGGNYIYFTVKDNEKFPTASAVFLIENGLVESCADGLFEDTPQTFRAAPAERFEEFKARYEAV